MRRKAVTSIGAQCDGLEVLRWREGDAPGIRDTAGVTERCDSRAIHTTREEP